MMSKIFLAALTTSSAFAAMTEIEQQFVALMTSQGGALRQFSGQALAAVQKMNDEGYGCWCYFYEKHGRGRGAPVDELDGFCKILHEGYECAMIDSVEAGDDDCVPWEVPYIAAVGGTEDQIREGCINNNPNNTCAQNACSVEGYFVENLVALALSGNAADYDSFGHTQGGFDAIEQCPTKKGNGGGEKECCGNYPLRYPFKVLDGDRACCGTRTYKTSVLNCCNDGSVKANC